MKVSMDTGNFTITVEGEYSPEAKETALKNAMRWELQRDVVTKAYVALVGVDGKKGDSKVLPKGFERDSVRYDDESAAIIRMGAEEALSIRGVFDVTVTKHVAGETASPMKRATALVDTFIGTPMESAYRTVLDAKATDDRDALIALAHAKGLGIQPPKA